jgi:hypothetical protein
MRRLPELLWVRLDRTPVAERYLSSEWTAVLFWESRLARLADDPAISAFVPEVMRTQDWQSLNTYLRVGSRRGAAPVYRARFNVAASLRAALAHWLYLGSESQLQIVPASQPVGLLRCGMWPRPYAREARRQSAASYCARLDAWLKGEVYSMEVRSLSDNRVVFSASDILNAEACFAGIALRVASCPYVLSGDLADRWLGWISAGGGSHGLRWPELALGRGLRPATEVEHRLGPSRGLQPAVSEKPKEPHGRQSARAEPRPLET